MTASAQEFVLTINVGLSTIKFSLFLMDGRPDRQLSGKIDLIGGAIPTDEGYMIAKIVKSCRINYS